MDWLNHMRVSYAVTAAVCVCVCVCVLCVCVCVGGRGVGWLVLVKLVWERVGEL